MIPCISVNVKRENVFWKGNSVQMFEIVENVNTKKKIFRKLNAYNAKIGFNWINSKNAHILSPVLLILNAYNVYRKPKIQKKLSA